MTAKRASVYKLILNDNLFDKVPSLITMLSRDDKSFDDRFVNSGKSVESLWPSGVTVFVDGSQPVDYLLCGPKYYAVSEAAKQVIEDTDSGVEFLPVDLVKKKSREFFGKYWVLNILNTVEALDWEHTRWISDEIPYKEPDAFLRIVKPAFKLKLLETHHIFVLRVAEHIRSGIYISANLKKTLEARNATVGMDFMPIKVV